MHLGRACVHNGRRSWSTSASPLLPGGHGSELKVRATRAPSEVKAIESLYDVFNRISDKTGRAMWPKGFCSPIASCNATETFVLGHADGVTRVLSRCSVSFDAKIRDLCDGTQVGNFILKLEFLVEFRTGSFQSTDDICGKFSETEPPSAILPPRD